MISTGLFIMQVYGGVSSTTSPFCRFRWRRKEKRRQSTEIQSRGRIWALSEAFVFHCCISLFIPSIPNTRLQKSADFNLGYITAIANVYSFSTVCLYERGKASQFCISYWWSGAVTSHWGWWIPALCCIINEIVAEKGQGQGGGQHTIPRQRYRTERDREKTGKYGLKRRQGKKKTVPKTWWRRWRA